MEKQYQIIDNFLSNDDFDAIKEAMMSGFFPWYYNPGTLPYQEQDLQAPFQFTHTFYNDNSPLSNFYNNLLPLVEKIDPFVLVKIKANLNTLTESQVKYGWHTDYPSLDFPNFSQVGRTAVYYLTDSDGPTILKVDGKEVAIDCVANRFVWFNPSLIHTGTSPTNVKARSLINFNYIPK